MTSKDIWQAILTSYHTLFFNKRFMFDDILGNIKNLCVKWENDS